MASLKLLKLKSEILLRKIGSKFGADIKMTDEEIFVKQIQHNNIELIFDIGANTGQFGDIIFKLGYKGRMVSFEPLSSAHKVLENKSRKFKNWEIAERCAIGSEDGEIKIHISKNSESSSVLDILDEHIKAAPESEYVGEEMCKIYKLDSIGKKYAGNAGEIFIKIDAQGFEENILRGAENFLTSVRGLLIETSLVRLYEGQALFPQIYEMVIRKGFELWGVYPAFVDKQSGRVLQVDTIFFK